MNVYAIIILAALLVDVALEVTADRLNLRALKLNVPPDLEGLYKPEEYRKSQQYVRETTRYGLITSAFTLAILLAFWFSGGFEYFDDLVRGWGFHPLVTGLLFIAILMLAYSIITLPFSIYGTFVIEGKYGFNRTIPRVFIMDRIKGLGLAAVLGGPLLAGVLALFMYTGIYAWVYAWIAVTLFSLATQYIAPTWIMPLFNKFKPLEEGELRDAILNYARSVKFPIKNVFVMDGSKRSTRSNAFFTGFGNNKRIALFDTLIAEMTVPEMVAVLAHEIGHYKKKHVLQGTIIGILHTGLLLFLLSLFVDSQGLYQAFYLDEPSVYAGLLFFGLLYTPLEMVLSIVMQMFSRKHEYEADRFAAETVTAPAAMVEALKKLSATNLSNMTPHPFYVFLNYSHPPLLQRVQAIQQVRRLNPSNN